ncbi:MAG: transglycosylase [Hyphomicrobiales bacterium]|nr:transglycosylase [Hyphomicrobiales bacterium]
MRLEKVDFDHLPGWTADDHAAALSAFAGGADVLADHPPKPRASGIAVPLLAERIREAANQGDTGAAAARRFFETRFEAYAVAPDRSSAFFTGYYEPVVAGTRTPSSTFAHPIYARPGDLVDIDPDCLPSGFETGSRFGQQRTDGSLSPYPDRAAIRSGVLADRGLELVYLADPVDVFFIHIQGSARIRLIEGGEMRVTYAAKSGHPYTPIGRVLIEMGVLPPGGATMATIRRWLADNPGDADAVMARNRSYIFFRETPVADANLGPVAAAKVPLTPGRSLAVDRLIHTFHTPVWVDTRLPDDQSFRRLMIAHDTGSAIVGAGRGDIFIGSGGAAGKIAGALQSTGRFVVLFPRPE